MVTCQVKMRLKGHPPLNNPPLHKKTLLILHIDQAAPSCLTWRFFNGLRLIDGWDACLPIATSG